MAYSYHEMLILLIIACSLSLPGHAFRWIKYRALGDILAAISCVCLILASSWQNWSDEILDPLEYSSTILFTTIILWCITSLFVALTFLQTQTIQPEYYKRRLRGKKWWERSLFNIGFVSCGCEVHELEDTQEKHGSQDIEPDRSHKGIPYFIGGAFLCLIWFSSMYFTFDDQRVFRLFAIILMFGILLLAGGAIDWFVVASRGYSHKKRKPSDGFCSKCGYDLRGLTEQRCPECGKSF